MQEGPWRLLADGEVIAELHVTDVDFPWANGRIDRLPGFERVEPLFAAELQILNGSGAEDPAWTAAYEQVRSATAMEFPDGSAVGEYLLHVEGDRAWWRWSRKRFDRA